MEAGCSDPAARGLKPPGPQAGPSRLSLLAALGAEALAKEARLIRRTWRRTSVLRFLQLLRDRLVLVECPVGLVAVWQPGHDGLHQFLMLDLFGA